MSCIYFFMSETLPIVFIILAIGIVAIHELCMFWQIRRDKHRIKRCACRDWAVDCHRKMELRPLATLNLGHSSSNNKLEEDAIKNKANILEQAKHHHKKIRRSKKPMETHTDNNNINSIEEKKECCTNIETEHELSFKECVKTNVNRTDNNNNNVIDTNNLYKSNIQKAEQVSTRYNDNCTTGKPKVEIKESEREQEWKSVGMKKLEQRKKAIDVVNEEHLASHHHDQVDKIKDATQNNDISSNTQEEDEMLVTFSPLLSESRKSKKTSCIATSRRRTLKNSESNEKDAHAISTSSSIREREKLSTSLAASSSLTSKARQTITPSCNKTNNSLSSKTSEFLRSTFITKLLPESSSSFASSHITSNSSYVLGLSTSTSSENASIVFQEEQQQHVQIHEQQQQEARQNQSFELKKTKILSSEPQASSFSFLPPNWEDERRDICERRRENAEALLEARRALASTEIKNSTEESEKDLLLSTQTRSKLTSIHTS